MQDHEDFDARDGEAEPVEVPWTALSAEALGGVIDSFVLREGTDYGAHELAHEEKVARVMAGLQRGDVRILFDPKTSSVTLVEAVRRPRKQQ